MGVRRTGDWARARKLLAAGPARLKVATDRALRQEAEGLRTEVVRGLTRQAPGGKPLKPLSPWTIAVRQMQGFSGTKALIRRADLRNGIQSIVRGATAFIGVPRKAKVPGGKSLVDVARIHEEGSDPIIIPITPRMRRFIHAARQRAGIPRRSGPQRQGSPSVVVTQVPARPFLKPAFAKFKRGAQKRFLARVAKELGYTSGL